MRGVFIALFIIVMFAIILPHTDEQIDEYVWTESCYGIECTDPEPTERKDWGGQYQGTEPFCWTWNYEEVPDMFGEEMIWEKTTRQYCSI